MGVVQINWKIVWLIVGVIVAFFVLRFVYRKIKRANAGKAGEINFNQVSPNINYDNYAKRAHDALTGWWTDADERDKIAADLNALNNDELKHVSNRYLFLYGEEDNETLLTLMNNYTFCWPCSDVKALTERMEKLGLS